MVQDNIDDGTNQNIGLNMIAATTDTKFHSLFDKNKEVDVVNVVAPILDNVTGNRTNHSLLDSFSGATGYKLYYDTNPNVSTSDSFISIASNNNTYIIHSGRNPSTTYYYSLVATTASGDSVMSLEKSTAATAFMVVTN